MKILRLTANPHWRRSRCSPASFTSRTSLPSFASFHYSVRLDFHQHFRRNQLADFHHARRRPDLSEKFSMRSPDLFPFGNVCHINSRPYNVFQARACLDERRLDVFDRLHRLRAQIAHAHDLSIRSRRCCSRHGDDVADPYRARVTHNRLPRCSARNILTRHLRSFRSCWRLEAILVFRDSRFTEPKWPRCGFNLVTQFSVNPKGHARSLSKSEFSPLHPKYLSSLDRTILPST